MTKLHFEDLTKITCPFGMLDDDTRERLKECDEIEFFDGCAWHTLAMRIVHPHSVYRAKTKPKRFVKWVQWDEDDEAVCMEERHEADELLDTYGGYIYRIERDEDGSNPTIELVETGE